MTIRFYDFALADKEEYYDLRYSFSHYFYKNYSQFEKDSNYSVMHYHFKILEETVTSSGRLVLKIKIDDNNFQENADKLYAAYLRKKSRLKWEK